MIRPGPEERFERFQRPGPNGCLDWTGSLMKNGYGSFRVNGKTVYAHRFAVELSGRGIPKGMHVDHLCRRKCCVNPDHLEVVSCQIEGQMLRIIAGTADDAAATMRNVRSSVTALSGRRVVAKLTGPLGALLNGPDAEAARVVVETVRVTPVSILTSKQARHQLGKAKMAKLEEFLGGQQ